MLYTPQPSASLQGRAWLDGAKQTKKRVVDKYNPTSNSSSSPTVLSYPTNRPSLRFSSHSTVLVVWARKLNSFNLRKQTKRGKSNKEILLKKYISPKERRTRKGRRCKSFWKKAFIFSSVSYLWDILRITPCNPFHSHAQVQERQLALTIHCFY